MPILDIPHRLVKFGGGLPSFPAVVVVHAQLAPKELFGEEPLSGRLVVVPPGHQVQLKPDMWHGGVRHAPGGRFKKAPATAALFELALRVEGSVATVEGEIAADSAFRRCIEMVAKDLPALLAGALHGPVRVEEVFGNVGDKFFEVEVRGTFQNVVWSGGPETLARSISEEMDRFSKVSPAVVERVFAASRYVNHARWLAYQGAHPAQFAGEQLLNLNKAIEVLLPHGSIDELRETLEKLGLQDELIELFAALAHVRNQVDVGHGAIELLEEKEHASLHTFVLYTNELVTWLVTHVATLAADGRFELRPLTVETKRKRDGTLARVGQLLNKVNPLRPETFLRK